VDSSVILGVGLRRSAPNGSTWPRCTPTTPLGCASFSWKGSVERVGPLSRAAMAADGTAEPLDPDALLQASDGLAAEGLRELATAVRFVTAAARRRRRG
jgi:magnesium-transporting ATPase (P-type)